MMITNVASSVSSPDTLPQYDSHTDSDHFVGHHYEMPSALLFVRSTPEFTKKTVPKGLLDSHQLASHLWARLTVLKGCIRFTFEEPEVFTLDLGIGQHVDIPPLIRHHVLLLPEGSFSLSFFRKSPEV
jgi:tellurite resistance-related uncharacterized protein